MRLEDAIIQACHAHRGQVDKGGAPYILHPLRVMLRMHTEDERVVAVLHDSIEDATDPKRQEELLWNAGLTYPQWLALQLLTRVPHAPYPSYIERLAVNTLARRVKMADLQDNLDLSRLGHEPTEADLARDSKYLKAFMVLTHTEEKR